MKYTVLVYLLLFLSTITYGQVDVVKDAIGSLTGGQSNLVHDPANKAQLLKVLAESKKTYSAIKKQLQFIEKAREEIAKVNNTVRQVKYIDDIRRYQDEIYDINQKSLNMAKELNVVDQKEIIEIVRAINTNLISIESTLNLAKHFLEDDFFKMSTAERLEALYKIRSETLDYRATAIHLYNQMYDFASLHYLQQLYGNDND